MEKKIREAFEEAGITQAELAKASDIDRGIISRFLASDRTITLPVADCICESLGLELVQTKKTKLGERKMIKRNPFRKGCSLKRVRILCDGPIKERRGKMICDQILKELESGYLTEATTNWLAKWVNPRRSEPKVQPAFEAISRELFGRRISRTD